MRRRKLRRLINRQSLKSAYRSVKVNVGHRVPILLRNRSGSQRGVPIEKIVTVLILLILVGALGYALGVNMNGLG